MGAKLNKRVELALDRSLTRECASIGVKLKKIMKLTNIGVLNKSAMLQKDSALGKEVELDLVRSSEKFN